jgi:predicted MPP superfamily phosphohydrolase
MGWLIRFVVRGVVAGVVLGALLLIWGLLEARSDPVVRRAAIAMADWPAGAAPVRVVLISDIHAGTLSVPPDRLRRIVAQVNALAPDLVLIAGDSMPGHKAITPASATARLAPLAGLRARLGVVAVPGNHDHWTELPSTHAALEAAGVTLLANEAAVYGPLVIGAVDDVYSRHADPEHVVRVARRLPGARVILTHSPDIAPGLPGDFGLLLAGHTHCGQAVIPWYGPVASVSKYGDRYRCGIIREGGRVVVVTAGIGTSGPPLRFNARPDIWVLMLGPR